MIKFTDFIKDFTEGKDLNRIKLKFHKNAEFCGGEKDTSQYLFEDDESLDSMWTTLNSWRAKGGNSSRLDECDYLITFAQYNLYGSNFYIFGAIYQVEKTFPEKYDKGGYNIKGKEFLATLSKYYVSDLGLRQMILGNRNIDMGHILENIIYLELLRRKVNVYVGQFDKNEIDFVVINSNEVEYYQVALTVLDENTLKRELAAFKNIKDNYPKYLITLDDVLPNTDYEGIKVINALEWLLGE